MTLRKIVHLCERHGFIRKTLDPISNKQLFTIDSTGILLRENLRHEWFNDLVINKDISCFMSGEDQPETLKYAKSVCSDTLPFAIAQVSNVGHSEPIEIGDERSSVKPISFGDHLGLNSVLKCTIFVSPSHSTHLFHQWQGQRRIWWRRFAASPGRYTLTDIQSDNNGQTVNIQAKYDWTNHQLVETLRLDTQNDTFNPEQLLVKNGRKQVTAHTITSRICLMTMFLNSILDAYEEPIFQNTPRELLRFHRKLAPYKISFAIPTGQKSVVDELKDLALYLCRQLRTDHVSCLLLPFYKNNLDAQWKQYDQMGIPYNVLLNEKTLKDGVTFLRSRDTTLKEQVHISSLRTYVEQLFRNY